MNEGFGATNIVVQERDQARRLLEIARQENRLLRKVLAEIRPVLITNQHKRAVDKVLKARPS
jgi:hypothetical protein